MADTATQTMPVVGHAIFDHAAEVQRILLQLEHERIDGGAPLSNQVRKRRRLGACCLCVAPCDASSGLSAFGRTDLAGVRVDRHGVCPLSDTERLEQRDADADRAGVAVAELVWPADAVQALKRFGVRARFRHSFRALI